MRFPTSADNRKREVLQLEHFLGVDYSNSPMRAAKYHSPDAQNFINRNGVNVKRNGWEEKLRLPARVNGIWDFIADNEHHIIAQAGRNFYRINDDYTYTNITGGLSRIIDERSVGFVYQDKLWVLCGDFVCYGKWDNEWKMRRVADIAYIPTTSTNIDNDEAIDTARSSLEEVNLLSSWRKNEMVGTNAGATFTVDSGAIDPGTLVTAEVYIKSDNEDGYIFKTYSGTNKLYDGDVEVGSINYENGKITFNSSTAPPIDGESNITVTFSFTSEGYADRVNNCTIGILFGVAGNTDRLFISGNPNYKNRVLWSEKEDFTYFPDLNYADCGNSTVEIMGFSRLGDGTLAVHKANNWQDASIYLIVGSWQESKIGDSTVYLPMFTVRAGAIGETMYTKYGNAVLNNDCLIVSKSGVYGIELAENVATNERYAIERSPLINGKLLTHTGLHEAVGVVYDQKYFLAVDDVCYVADGRFFNNGQYEWWYWVNMPVRVWSVIGDNLWFGSYDGRVCVIGNNFVDLSYQTSEIGDLTIDYENNKVIINRTLWDDVVNNDYVYFQNDVFGLLTDDIELIGNVIRTNETDIMRFYEELKVRVDQTYGTGLSAEEEYIVRNVDYGQCTFELYAGEEIATPTENSFRILQNLKGLNTKVTNAEGLEFQLVSGDQLITLTKFDGYGADNITAKFEFRRNVIAYWYTPVFDMGTNIYSKTLYSMTIATEPRVDGHLEFGYKTWKGEPELKKAQGVGLFRFDNINFNNFTFNTANFATSYTVKAKERNVNYAMFKFYSDNDRDCAVNNMSIVYSINRYNRGVR